MKHVSKLTVLVAISVAGLVFGIYTPPSAAQGQGMKMKEPAKPMTGMKEKSGMTGMGAPAGAPVIPAVTGYTEGKRILFIHTETSDPKIAKLLTDMMGGSPVLVVPSLAKIKLHSHVYVFTNGTKPSGPMGPLMFQPDVFPDPPGSPGYSPLRSIVLVTWKNPAAARFLKSAADVEKAIKGGEMTIKEPGIVVNMPFLTWPGGKR